jgi:spermidine synthase
VAEHATALAVVAVGAFIGVLGIEILRDRPAAGLQPLVRRLERWNLDPSHWGDFRLSRLFLISVIGLFLELLLIRWISSEVRVFAYLKNFVLIACFLGFGLGCYRCSRPANLAILLFPLTALVAIVTSSWAPLRATIDELPLLLGTFSEVHVWGVVHTAVDSTALLLFAKAVAVSVALFAIVATIFIPIGQLIGWHLESAPRGIAAYSVNILGSLAGVLLFSLLSSLHQPPWVWILVAGMLLTLTLRSRPVLVVGSFVCTVACGVMMLIPSTDWDEVHWSPYQKLSLAANWALDGSLWRWHLQTNNTWFQRIVDLSIPFRLKHTGLFTSASWRFNGYDLPYALSDAPSSVLVLGSGMGNDVAGALRHGAERVVAVEIDPLIVQLGRRLHFERPYDRPEVEVVIEDARQYIERSDERFDLIVFALLDSHTTVSHYSNVRIDNYVYTIEAMHKARDLLAPDGLLVVKFQADTPWIAGRLDSLLTSVFSEPPLKINAVESIATGGHFFISGNLDVERLAAADPELGEFVRTNSFGDVVPTSPTSDDWPFFYQQHRGLPPSVVVVSLTLILLTWAAVRRAGTRGGMSWHFFFLGAGFLLLEVHIVSRMALLFGTTWVVNAFIISIVLCFIVLANIVVERSGRDLGAIAYVGLFVAIGTSWVIPLDWFFVGSSRLGAVLAATVLCVPAFFAGIVFIRSFAAVGFSGHALGSNLMGALFGGVLESISLWTGIRSVVVVAAILYLAATWTRPRLAARPSARSTA